MTQNQTDKPTEATDASLLARLQEIQARVEKATKGPWSQGPYYHADVNSPAGVIRANCWMAPQAIDDAAFIAHARQDIPYLLEALRRSGEALRRLQEELEQLKGNARPSAAE